MGAHPLGAQSLGAQSLGAQSLGAQSLGAQSLGAHSAAAHRFRPGASDAGATPAPPAPPVAPPGLPAAHPRDPLHTVEGLPKLLRPRDGAVVGGVAAGLADHLKVAVLWVRLVFAVTAVLGGAGVLAYALLWIFVPPAPEGVTAAGEPAPPRPVSSRERRQAIGIAALGVALLITGTALGLGSIVGWILGPFGLAAVGGAFIWREADDARRARWRRTAAGLVAPSRASLWRLLGGVALVVGGLSVFAIGQLDFTAVRSALIAVLLTLVGVGIITVPWWMRLVRDLGDERRARVRERERAEIAAHLHDSVLQTLALIQRQSGDSREVVRLARGQERELRTWLYGPTGYATGEGASGDRSGSAASTSTLAASLAVAAGEVEDTYAIAVAPVVVGDAAMDPHLAALVAAAREAMVNAAKHAGVPEVSVYAEVEDDTARVFVRDRGSGFDPADVRPDRRGLVESVRGRMERHGGTAVVRSSPGAGTEVELSMPVRDPAAADPPSTAGVSR